MLIPTEVQTILQLKRQGCGTRTIARELGISRNTVRRYLKAEGYVPYKKPKRVGVLEEHKDWLKQTFLQHKGNAAVIQQQLEKVHKIKVSLRTIQRAVEPYRAILRAQQKATVRFETPPGRQIQADFGSISVLIGGVKRRIHLAVLTLGYSRRCFVQVFENEKRESWLTAIEGAIFHFGGATEEILIDNARALVDEHNLKKGVVRINPAFADFCAYWGMTPRACAPYRARTKGKDERTIQYVKRNAIAGHEFASLSQLQHHLNWWMKEVADLRNHGTLKQRPIDLFELVEKAALKPPRPSMGFPIHRLLRRKVHIDSCVEVETNHYSVPWRFLEKGVSVRVDDCEVLIFHEGEEIARHARSKEKYTRVIEASHLDGIVKSREDLRQQRFGDIEKKGSLKEPNSAPKSSALLRPLDEYQAIIEGEQP